MTLQQLYSMIDGDYAQAIKVMRIDKLVDKHIRKLPANPIFPEMNEAAKTLDPVRLFESAHAMKGVCSNLGLVKLSALASEIAEEFRPGNPRTVSDDAVIAKIAQIDAMFKKAAEGIKEYEQSAQ